MKRRATFIRPLALGVAAMALGSTWGMAQVSGSKQAPAAPAAAPALPAAPEVTATDVASAIDSYLVSAGERFRLYDVGGKEELSLEHATTDKDTLRSLGPDRYVMTASFTRADGKKYGVDFFVVGQAPEDLQVIADQVAVRTVNGESRYEWVRYAKRDAYYRSDPAVAAIVAKIENTPIEPEPSEELPAGTLLGETGQEYTPPVVIPGSDTKGPEAPSP